VGGFGDLRLVVGDRLDFFQQVTVADRYDTERLQAAGGWRKSCRFEDGIYFLLWDFFARHPFGGITPIK